MAEESNSKKLMIILALAVGGILADYFDPEIEFTFLEVAGGIAIVAVTIWFWPTTKVGRYIFTFETLILLMIGLAIIASDLFGELPTWVFVALFAAAVALTPFCPSATYLRRLHRSGFTRDAERGIRIPRWFPRTRGDRPLHVVAWNESNDRIVPEEISAAYFAAQTANREIVIGNNTNRSQLFGTWNPTGRTLTMSGARFQFATLRD
ncbi:MAG: hypothetical protein OXO50_13670 [Caldilineaceae bacterium]|nr:hypothetical protein [Caldilineaceae bacterium]MDE0196724.1 hypothetical protein [Caldilineaceae bacterium]